VDKGRSKHMGSFVKEEYTLIKHPRPEAWNWLRDFNRLPVSKIHQSGLKIGQFVQQ